MFIRDGVIYHAPWETSIAYFTQLSTADRKVSSSMKLAKMFASAMHVPIAVLADDTLDWSYKLTRLITLKEIKQCSALLDMLITNLQDHPALSVALQQAYYLRGAWCQMVNAHRLASNGQHVKPYTLSATRARILDHIASMLDNVRD